MDKYGNTPHGYKLILRINCISRIIHHTIIIDVLLNKSSSRKNAVEKSLGVSSSFGCIAIEFQLCSGNYILKVGYLQNLELSDRGGS